MDSTDSDEPNDRQHGDVNEPRDDNRDEPEDASRNESEDASRNEPEDASRNEPEDDNRDEPRDTSRNGPGDDDRDEDDAIGGVIRRDRNVHHGGIRRTRGRLDRLRSLLSDLESEGTIERTGRVASARGVVDYRYSIMSGFDEAIPDRVDGDETERRRLQDVDSDEYLITTRQEGSEFVVVADLTNVDAEDLTVGIDDVRDFLVIGVEGRAVERVPLPVTSVVTDASFSNGILEVRMQPSEVGTDATEHGGTE